MSSPCESKDCEDVRQEGSAHQVISSQGTAAHQVEKTSAHQVVVHQVEGGSVGGQGCRPDVVKDCHLLPQHAAVEKEKELQRIATRAGM